MYDYSLLNAIMDQGKLCSNMFRLSSDYNHLHIETFKKTMMETKGITDLKSIYESWLSNLDKTYGIELKSKRFSSILSSYIDSLIDFRKTCKILGLPINEIDEIMYEYKKFLFNFPSAKDIEKNPLSTPSEIIYSKKKIELIHYLNDNPNSIPVILVYAQINRFNIMDLMPEKSVVQNLMSKGFDVFVIHWGYSGIHDDYLTVDDYIRRLDESIHKIKEKTNQQKISMIGYCWGGILSLMYTALFPNNIQNLTILATPVDFSKDTSHLSIWAKDIDVDKMVDEFGHLDPMFLDVGFFMRNPSRNFDKYFKMMSKLSDKSFLENFFAMERWLYNTPPIPGEYFRKIIKDGYKNNLLIKNQLQVLGNSINLKKIHCPVLMVVAAKDDLVTPKSTLSLGKHISSDKKMTMVYQGGHVGLCISSNAQKSLWPKIAEWINDNSEDNTLLENLEKSKMDITMSA